jgi:hypothetical protein
MKAVLAGLLALALVGQSSASWAGSTSSESTLEQIGYGAGSVLGTLVYSPLKASVCILGGIGSAFTAIISPPTAGRVAGASCGGTWLITPDVLKGHEQVKFMGDVPASAQR